MGKTDPHSVTMLIESASKGGAEASARLIELVYEELRAAARQQIAMEKPGLTLQPTALVHEAFLRLLGAETAGYSFANRRHFFAAAAEAMRRILIERARAMAGPKRGGHLKRQDLHAAELASLPPTPTPAESETENIDWLALDQAIARLDQQDPQLGEVVRLRYYAGLSVNAVAQVLDVSERTIKRQWAVARAFLGQELRAREGQDVDER
jgi:RNA polymerase sigma factor (TIGR02999 family)